MEGVPFCHYHTTWLYLSISTGFSTLSIPHTLLALSIWPFKTCLEVNGTPVTTLFLLVLYRGPKEPKYNTNTYLRPLVNEMNELWKGVPMQLASGILTIVWAALICVSCDIPATRKVCGFVGHHAYHACSRCLKSFETTSFGAQTANLGHLATFNHTVKKAKKHRDASTRAKQKEIEKEHGLRYSVLLEILYFDVVRCSVIDPIFL